MGKQLRSLELKHRGNFLYIDTQLIRAITKLGDAVAASLGTTNDDADQSLEGEVNFPGLYKVRTRPPRLCSSAGQWHKLNTTLGRYPSRARPALEGRNLS